MSTILVTTLTKNLLVLAKILDTLKPQYIFLWDTNYAKRNELDIKAKITAELYLKEHDLPKERYKLTLDDKFNDPVFLYESIKSFLEKIPNSKEDEIFLDVTAGRGLTSVFLASISRKMKEKIGVHSRISYCDFDSNKVIIFDSNDMEMQTQELPIRMDFAIKNIENRIAINNLNIIEGYKTIYKSGVASYFYGKEHDFDKLLQSMNRPEFRKLFNSYNEIMVDWLKKTIIANISKINDFSGVFATVLKNILDEKVGVAVSENLKKQIRRLILSNFRKAVDLRELEIGELIEKLSNGEIDKAFETIRRDLAPQIGNILFSKKFSKKSECNKVAKQIIIILRSQFIHEINLQSLLINEKLASPHFPRETQVSMIKDYCENVLKDKSLSDLLLKDKLSLLFEDIINYKFFKIITKSQNIQQNIAGLYAGLKIGSDKIRNSLEIDTFILLKSGNVLNYEAKQHFSSANIKDLDARIRNAKEFIGAKTIFKLVFPINSNDLNFENFTSETGSVKKPAEWINSLNTFNKIKNGYKVVYFDKIEESLKREIERIK